MSFQKLNIIYVCREVSPYTGGGIGTYIANVAKAMAAKGHSVSIITDLLGNDFKKQNPSIPNVRFIEPITNEVCKQTHFMSEHQQYSFRVYQTLLQLQKNKDIDVIEFPEFRGEGFCSIQAKRTLNHFENTKLIVKCHTPSSLIRDINDEYFFQPRHEMDFYIEDYSVQNADGVTSPSQSLAEYFSKRLNRKDIKICPYPLDLTEWNEEKNITKPSLKEVLYFGSIQPRKGLDHFIKAAIQVLKKDPEFIFKIAGGERNKSVLWKNYSELLKDQIPEQYQNNIQFIGALPAEDIPTLLKETSVCLLPSRWENWANACLEAMSLGCIVLASSNGGMGEMIQDGKNGFSIDPETPNITAEILLKLPAKTRKASKISKQAIVRAHTLTEPTQIVNRIENNYAEVSNSSSKADHREKPLVSVIIPYFNQQNTIQETIDSVHKSTYSNIEIIVVNDGSDDPNAIEVFENLSGITKINKDNGGLSSARNNGIGKSQGEFFMPLDSDDLISPEYIEVAVNALQKNNDLSYIGCYAQNFGSMDDIYAPLGFVKNLMCFQNTDIKCCGLFRKSAFVTPYDENMYSYEDWDFLISIHENGGKSDVIPEPLFHYRRYHESMVFSTANHQKSHLIQYMMNKHINFWKDNYAEIARILVRLWADEQFEREFSNVEVIQIYYGIEGVYSEEHSSILTVYKGQKQNLKFNLPTVGNITSIRIDPSASPGLIEINRISLKNTISRQVLVDVKNEQHFNNVHVAGTANGKWEKDSFHLLSTGDDPQIHIGGFQTNGKKMSLEIELTVDSSKG